jgi:hypothetical protein
MHILCLVRYRQRQLSRLTDELNDGSSNYSTDVSHCKVQAAGYAIRTQPLECQGLHLWS